MADDLYGGSAPKQGCFGCLPKVLHDAKPAEQATLDTPFFIAKSFFDRLIIYLLYNGIVWGIAWGSFGKNEKCLKFYLKGLRKAVKYVILIVYGN